MSKTLYDLSEAVKRHLTSNSNLVNLVQGQAQNSADLKAQIDAAIVEGANNARLYAERLHDFAFNDMTGQALLTNGCSLSLDRVPVRQNYGDVDSVAISSIVRIDSSADDWPELVLAAEFAETNLVSVKFAGTVVHPIVAGVAYSVSNSRVNEDGTVSFRLGIAPGQQISYSGLTAVGSVAKLKNFKTIQQVYLYDSATRSIEPMATIKRRTQVIREIKRQGLSLSSASTRQQAIIAGRELHIEPSETVHIALDGNVWMDGYSTDEDTDMLLQHGFDFMMWQTIIEVNHMLLKFVARQEGTISPPTQARDAAWESLVIWDSTQVDGNIYHDL